MAQPQQQAQPQQKQSEQQPRGKQPDWSRDVDLVSIYFPHTHMMQDTSVNLQVGGRVRAGKIEGIIKRMVLLVNGNARCDVVQGANPRDNNPGTWRHVVFTPPFYAEVAEVKE